MVTSSLTCAFCGRSGPGVQFNIFTPRFQPFGTACVDCEASLPEGTPHPAQRRQQPGSVPCADGFHEHETEDEATACSACIRDIHENAAADCERDER